MVEYYLNSGRSTMIDALTDKGVYFDKNATNAKLAILCAENFGNDYPDDVKPLFMKRNEVIQARKEKVKKTNKEG